ncbi:ATP-binding cassette domain-containing protein [Curtobacterium flaccumfaciens]|nr:ATP-binding cassette domain-containing protein [Curtobacterium flaccumfaciens]
MSAVLDVRGLTVTIGGTPIVHGVDLRVDACECLALVGASGSGKTVTARAVLGLSAPGAAVHADVFTVDGVDVGGYTDRRWRRLRGSRVGYVGQEALGALDPLRPVGREVADSIRLHTEMRAAERVDAVRDALAAVGLDPDIATDGRLAGTRRPTTHSSPDTAGTAPEGGVVPAHGCGRPQGVESVPVGRPPRRR